MPAGPPPTTQTSARSVWSRSTSAASPITRARASAGDEHGDGDLRLREDPAAARQGAAGAEVVALERVEMGAQRRGRREEQEERPRRRRTDEVKRSAAARPGRVRERGGRCGVRADEPAERALEAALDPRGTARRAPPERRRRGEERREAREP